MIRHRHFVAICLLTASSAMAAELYPLTASPSSRRATNDSILAQPASFASVTDSLPTDPISYPGEQPEAQPAQPAAATLGCDCGTTCGPRDYHSVCDCGCHVPYLGCYDNPCGCYTTDFWCQNPCASAVGEMHYDDKTGRWVSNDAFCDVNGTEEGWDAALRLGGWGVSHTGSVRKVGEYQALNSSLFYDVDAIHSDGERTLDFWVSGLDNSTNNVRMNYYGPNVRTKLRYDMYLHRLDHDPLYGVQQFGNPPPGPSPNDNVVVRDLNTIGQDYAIHVQTLDIKFKGDVTDGIKWKLDLWGQKKDGQRQVNAVAHCFNINNPPAASNNTCHILSQAQRIDWTTGEISPGVEMKFENVSVDYSHTWRGFATDDAYTSRYYNHFAPFQGPTSNSNSNQFDYGIVPENLTSIDKLKVGWDVDDCNKAYATMLYGDTDSYLRGLHRYFENVDLRWINRSIDGVTLTMYGGMYQELNSQPTVMTSPTAIFPAGAETLALNSLSHPVDHLISRLGVRGNWRPWKDEGLSLVGGYEYELHERDYAVYVQNNSVNTPYIQPDTRTHKIEFGPEMRWSVEHRSFLRYRGYFIDEPMHGIRESDVRIDTNLPSEEHRVELGHTWAPTTNFMVTGQAGLVNRSNHDRYVFPYNTALGNQIHFNEQDYPFNLTVFYAPTERLHLNGGYAFFSNAVNQDVALGYRYSVASQTEVNRADYYGYANVLNVSGTYQLNCQWKATAGWEYVRGSNSFSMSPSTAGADWSQLGSMSDVEVETNRWTLGLDYEPTARTDVYVRYIYYDYRDIGSGLDSGVANMILGGASVVW